MASMIILALASLAIGLLLGYPLGKTMGEARVLGTMAFIAAGLKEGGKDPKLEAWRKEMEGLSKLYLKTREFASKQIKTLTD